MLTTKVVMNRQETTSPSPSIKSKVTHPLNPVRWVGHFGVHDQLKQLIVIDVLLKLGLDVIIIVEQEHRHDEKAGHCSEMSDQSINNKSFKTQSENRLTYDEENRQRAHTGAMLAVRTERDRIRVSAA